MFLSLALCVATLGQAQAESPPIAALVTLPAHLPQAITVAFSPNGKWLATSGANRFVSLRDPTTGEIRHVLSGHLGLVHQVAFSPDSTLLASASGDGTVILWSVESGEKVVALQVWSGEQGVARTVDFSSDGHLLATGASDGTIKIWDIAERKSKRILTRQALPVTSVTFSPDGTLLATATGDWRRGDVPGDLRLWEVASGVELASLKEHECEIKRIAFNRTGKRLISAGVDRTILIWNVADRAVIGRLQIDAAPTSFTLLNDGDLLATGDSRGGVAAWDLARSTLIRRYAGHQKAVLGIAVDPAGRLLATASHDGTVKLWPAPSAIDKSP